jgi:ubiquinone/menaquinone biosynthesis C-methylase UbiE
MKFFKGVWSLLTLSVASDQIDPAIYARLFSNNSPMFERMSQDVLIGLPGGGTVLDLASGPGEPTLTLAKADPKLQIVCTDFQAEMNEKAKDRVNAAGVGQNVTFATTSADDLSQWKDNTFDAVTMSYGLMFIPDREKSLREIFRVLKPAGFAYLSVWKSLMFYEFAHEVIDEVAGKNMGEFAINPMKMSKANAVEKLAIAAGLHVDKSEILTYPFKMGSVEDTVDGLKILTGTMLKQLDAASGDGKASMRFHEIVEREVRERGWMKSDNDVVIPENSAQLLTIEKPVPRDEL